MYIIYINLAGYYVLAKLFKRFEDFIFIHLEKRWAILAKIGTQMPGGCPLEESCLCNVQ